MRITLRAKLVTGYLIVAAAGFIVLATWGTSMIRKQAQNELINTLYRNANYLQSSYKVNDGVLSQSQLESVAYVTNTEVWVIGTDNHIETQTGLDRGISEVKGFSPAAGIDGYYMIGRFYDVFREDTVSVYAPLTTAITPQGYVLLHAPLSAAAKEADRQLRFSYITLFFMDVLGLFFVVFVDRMIVRRAKKVRSAALEYVNGNLSYPVPIRGSDELTDIAVTDAELAHQVGTSGEDQHRFLANISHDFRSPLTSIKGYLTAIQDGTIPPEMQGKYIDVIIGETDRLTKLANSLLDMTQLENGIILDRSVFDINDLIRETLKSFEGRMIEKDLFFDVAFESPAQAVNADRARIDQVLHNLIDNAVKFSNYDSSIDISTRLHGEKVFVSVKDHGVGIAKENIPKIWERFYKTDSSRGKDKKGTGLGLAIVREIVQAHREQIDVISTPDVGTEFIFTLMAADTN